MASKYKKERDNQEIFDMMKKIRFDPISFFQASKVRQTHGILFKVTLNPVDKFNKLYIKKFVYIY